MANIGKTLHRGIVQFDFEPIKTIEEMESFYGTVTVVLNGLDEGKLKQLHFEVAIGDSTRPFEQSYDEFRPYSEIKKEIEESLQEGRISGEGN